MTDDLDSKTDVELDKLFALEIAAWQTAKCSAQCPIERGGMRLPNYFFDGEMDAWWHPTNERSTGVYAVPPKFATSADVVLPWLARHHYEAFNNAGGGVQIRLHLDYRTLAWSSAPFIPFARAAVIALLRAKRSSLPP